MWADLNVFTSKLKTAIIDLEVKAEELRATSDDPVTADHITRLEHTISVFREMLLHPPSWLL